MFIRIYSQDLELVGVVEDFVSLTWTRRYQKPGSFQFILPMNQANFDLCRRNRIIWFRGTPEGGLIDAYSIREGDDGATQIVMEGKMLTGLLDRRAIMTAGTAPDFDKVGADAVMYYVYGLARAIPHVVCAAPNPDFADIHIDDSDFYPRRHYPKTQEGGENLLLDIQSIAQLSGLGFRLRPDPKNRQIVLEAFRRVDHTVKGAHPIIFSSRDGDIAETVMTETTLMARTAENNLSYPAKTESYPDEHVKTITHATPSQWKTAANHGYGRTSTTVQYHEGEYHEGEEPHITIVYETIQFLYDTAMGDFESPKQCHAALSENDLAKTPSYRKRLKPVIRSYEFTVAEGVHYRYMQDFDVGDRLTIRKEDWGLQLTEEVVEVTQVFDAGGARTSVTLGEPTDMTTTQDAGMSLETNDD